MPRQNHLNAFDMTVSRISRPVSGLTRAIRRVNGRARYRTMTLAANEFIRRFLLHVLPKGFHRIVCAPAAILQHAWRMTARRALSLAQSEERKDLSIPCGNLCQLENGGTMALEQSVARHYTHGSLQATIFRALEASGKDIDRLAPDDLAAVDEFHIGGRQATIDFATQLGVGRGTNTRAREANRRLADEIAVSTCWSLTS